ncbi:hypothetical protein PQQ96_01710 [Paraburkholderia sediminicola]|uniref:hypothetical protein n=1 Tax=Paraburkholderia sediminicola TaxID=458836 RepID=UPI0038BB5EC0
MYIILTSKPGQYRTEAAEGIVTLDTYDYVYCGRHIATHVIAKLSAETKIKVIDEAEPPVVNLVPTKFLEKFATCDAALKALQHLAGHGNAEAQLIRR